jgi:uncharacterized phage protein (TIGR01671 family)
MNREIKFRAWHKDLKKMFKIGQITLEEGTWNFEPNDRGFIGMSIPYQPSFVLMQYTGLHDKNGKEIYDGDIVYCQTKYGKAKAIIKFIDGKFVAYWNSALTHPENGHHIACYEINKRFEVIGNIYDNPELLGGE